MQGFLSSMVFATMLSIGFGPIALIILRQSIACGFRGALPGALCAAVADAVFAAVAFYGLQTIKAFWLANNRLLTWVAIAYLFYLGGITFAKHTAVAQVKTTAGFIPVFLLTLMNPLTIVAISSYVIASGTLFEGLGLYLSLAGFLVGSFLGQMLYALGGSLIRTALIDNPDLDVINRIIGGLLIGFAVWQCARVLSGG